MSDTIWIRNLTGEKAVIPAGDRDRWKLHGWTEADEPVDGDFVWMEHPDGGIAKPGLIPWSARDYWLGIDWAPSAPPEPVNPALDPTLNDNAARAADAPPEGTVTQVAEWVGSDAGRARQALKTERERGTPRSTLVEALERVVNDSETSEAAPAAPSKEERGRA